METTKYKVVWQNNEHNTEEHAFFPGTYKTLEAAVQAANRQPGTWAIEKLTEDGWEIVRRNLGFRPIHGFSANR